MYTNAMSGHGVRHDHLGFSKICLHFCALVFSVLFGAIIVSESVGAAGSWLDGDPELIERRAYDHTKDKELLGCVEQLITIVYGDPFSKGSYIAPGCVVEGINYRTVKMYWSHTSRSGTTYISIGKDKRFYPLEPRILAGETWYHVPQTDRMIKVENEGSDWASLTIYDDVHIHASKDQRWQRYALKGGIYKFSVSTRGWGTSANGRYIVYGETSQRRPDPNSYRYIRYDTKTGERKGFGRSRAHDTIIPVFAVSNDGREIIATSRDGLLFWEVDTLCVVDINSFERSTCPERVLSADEHRNYSFPASTLQYNEDEQTIRYSSTTSDHSETVVYRKPGYESPKRIQYLALGDSYSSGEGDVTNGYIRGTESPKQCHLSPRSYPFLLRNKWSVSRDKMESVACSGAEVGKDYMSNVDRYNGQDNRLAGDPYSDFTKKRALEKFTPGIVPQIEFVKRYKPETITLTGGGNDIGFGRILRECAGKPGTCSYAGDSESREVIINTIYDHYDVMRDLISKIQAASPSTKIIIVGYPQFTAHSASGCGLNAGMLNTLEKHWIWSWVSSYNDRLKTVAADAGVFYADVKNSLVGGRLCESHRYVTGLHDLTISKLWNKNTQELFHPNAAGHAKMAETIYEQYPSVNPVQKSVVTMSLSTDKPENYQISRKTELTKDPDLLTKRGRISIVQPPVTFEPGSNVEIKMFSDPVVLGSAIAGEDGSFSFETTLPESIDIGHHFLMVKGKTFSGEPMTLYQFVTVVSDTPNDADGDGIPDDEDSCPFIDQWFDETTGEDICRNAKTLDHNESPFQKEVTSGNVDDVRGRENNAPMESGDATRDFLKKNGLLPQPPVTESENRSREDDNSTQYRVGVGRNRALAIALSGLLTVTTITLIIGKIYHVKKHSKNR